MDVQVEMNPARVSTALRASLSSGVWLLRLVVFPVSLQKEI